MRFFRNSQWHSNNFYANLHEAAQKAHVQYRILTDTRFSELGSFITVFNALSALFQSLVNGKSTETSTISLI